MDLHIILLLPKNVPNTFSPKPRSDVSRFLLIKDLLQFDSHKQPPLISEHQLFAFWVVTFGWFDCIISHKNENTNLRWCYTGQFEKTILSTNSVAPLFPGGGGAWGGTPYMKGVGMLIVLLRGVNFGFWSRLGCSGKNTIIFSHKGLF